MIERVRAPHGFWIDTVQVKAGSVGSVLVRRDDALSVQFDNCSRPVKVPVAWVDREGNTQTGIDIATIVRKV